MRTPVRLQWEQIGMMRRVGSMTPIPPIFPTAALDAESAEVLGNIKALL